MLKRKSVFTAATVILLVFAVCVVFIRDHRGPEQQARYPATHTDITLAQASLHPDTIKSSLTFEANQGQTAEQVRFLSRQSGYTLFLTTSGAVLSLKPAGKKVINNSTPDKALKDPQPGVLRIQYPGSNPAPRVTGQQALAAKSHYFIGNDPAHWQKDVPHFTRVEYQGLYPGVDLVYYGNDDRLEYDFVVAAGADPSQIRLAFEGADDLRVDPAGNLVLGTAAGELVNHAPYAYQQIDGVRREIASHYRIDNQQVSFQLAAYDAGRPLIIDPGLTYSSFLGGGARDEGNAIAVDGSGNFYVTGGTDSTNFPGDNHLYAAQAGDPPCQGGISNCASDAFVSKFSATGQLQFSVYLGSGSSLGDAGKGIAVDANGKIYITGYASFSFNNFPAPSDSGVTPYNSAFKGNSDAFVAVLSSDGAQLLYSSLIGGGLGDFGEAIAVDNNGDVYVTGYTHSYANFPLRNAAFPSSDGTSATADPFVFKLSPVGGGDSDLIYSTYLTGQTARDEGQGIAVDSAGNVYVTGWTDAFIFACGSNATSSSDAFLVKLSSAGACVYTKFFGGNDIDQGWGVATDDSYVYLVGQTASTDSPFSVTDGSSLQGTSDAFVLKLDASGVINYATYLGGGGDEAGYGIAVDGNGYSYVTGYTSSADFPFTSNLSNVSSSLQGASDAFVTKFSPTLSRLYSLYYGGSGEDKGFGIAVDNAGTSAYITGWSASNSNFLLTSTAAQSSPGGGTSDAFVARIGALADLSVVLNHNNTSGNPVLQGDTLTYAATVTNNGPDSASGIVLTVTLPTGVSYVSNDSGCSESAGVVSCSLADLARNASTTVQINVTLDVATAVTASTSVTGDEPDYNALNNFTDVTTTAGVPGTTVTTNPNDSKVPPPSITITNGPSSSGSSGGGGGGMFDFTLLLALIGSIVGRRSRLSLSRL